MTKRETMVHKSTAH